MKEATITCVFDAPRDVVWLYFTEPEYFAEWFGTEPFTTPVSKITMDVRPGGEFRAAMVDESDGTELPFVGHYREVAAPERIVQTLEDVSDPDNPDIASPDEQYPLIEQGVSGFYERLAEHVTRSKGAVA